MPRSLPKRIRDRLKQQVAKRARELSRVLDGPTARRPEPLAPEVAPRLANLQEAMLVAPRYRTSEDDTTLRNRLLAVVCDAGEVEAALSHFGHLGSKVEAIVLHEDGDRPSLPSGIRYRRVRELRWLPQLVPVIFGHHADRKVLALARQGVRHLVFARDPGYNPTIRFDPDFYQKNHAELDALFDQLADDESRLVLAGIVRMRTTGDYGYIRVSSYPEYDHPLVRPERGEVVFDLGMETAHTSLWFADRVGSGGHVFGFEASPEHWEEIQAALDEAGVSHVEMLRMGVWNEAGTLSFMGGMAGASRVAHANDPRATLEVPVIPIDTFVKEREIGRVGLLSFDIEGAEPEGLQGAADTIRRDHPKLQVSLYHRMPHLLELPRLINSFGKPYRFYMGHHSAQGLETDLYALPA